MSAILSILVFTTLVTMSIRHTIEQQHGDTQQRLLWIFHRALFSHQQSKKRNVQSLRVEKKLKMKDYNSSNQNNDLLRNKTERLQRTLADIKEKLNQLQQLRESQIMLQKPSKELAVVKMPVAPMGYMNSNFLLCGRNTLELLILVMTNYKEERQRTQFRDHWRRLMVGYARKTNLELKWRYMFVIGHDYEESARDVLFTNEAIFQRDLLRVHNPNTQTMGTIFGALNWANDGCSYRNILVIRPNMGLNIPVLYKLIHKADRTHKDFYVHHTLPSDSFQKTSKKQQLSDLDIQFQNSAWMVSRDALARILPLMKMYSNSMIPINYNLIWNYLSMLKFKRLHETKLMSNFKCQYQPDYALNILPDTMCLESFALTLISLKK